MFINQSVNVKDSPAIYALNFQISISKKNNKAVVTAISANDNLAFSLFPSYKKILKIDFGPIMKNQKKINLIFPILVYGDSPEKTKYTDEKGKALISLEAAAQAAYALYNPSKYHNISNGKIADKASNMNNSLISKNGTWQAITMQPLVTVIANIR